MIIKSFVSQLACLNIFKIYLMYGWSNQYVALELFLWLWGWSHLRWAWNFQVRGRNWVKVIGFLWFFLLGFVIDLLLLFLLRPNLWFVQKNFLLSGFEHFFLIVDFSCYLFVRFLGSVCKFFREEGQVYKFKSQN